MAVRALSDMTWEEVRDLGPPGPVALLPVGALEAHGPHLPLGTDCIIAEAMAREAGERLAGEGVEAVLLPALDYTAAGFAAGFPGTVAVDPGSVTRLVVDIARALSAQGFRALGIANAHLDPAHLASLREAVARLEGDPMPVAFPDITRRALAERLTDEFRSGACHAGRFEGSVVLAERPDLVREGIRAGLPPNPASLSVAIRRGSTTFEDAGGPRAYFGYPADATAEEGHATVRVLGGILAEAVLGAMERREAEPADRGGAAAGEAPR